MRNNRGEIIGQFQEGKNYKLMTCHHTFGNSITHYNSKHKHKISSRWKNNGELNESVNVVAVVVFDYKHAQKLQEEIKFEYSVLLV